MIDFLDMDSNKLVISEFYENDKAGKYEYATIYQREKVWSEEKKSFLIDSILKNYPIPPVFFRMKIDPDTGITKYDVIDGKQRLTTIRDFVEGKVSLPEDFGDDSIGNPELNGASFSDLDKLDKYKKQFWRYRIPIIFIETEDTTLIKNVFDRLNRNGEPLVAQELRHAQFGETPFYGLIEKLASKHVWRSCFEQVLEIDRMEDKEFTSELLILLLEKKILSYTKETLDDYYKKWAKLDVGENEKKYCEVMEYITKMDLDYSGQMKRVSHLYAIWVVAVLAYEQDIDPKLLGKCIHKFYVEYFSKKDCVGYEEYKKSMSSATKGVSSRRKRVNALLAFCKDNSIDITMTL
jgi:hypothetical protein